MSQGIPVQAQRLELSAPVKLQSNHDFSQFDCGEQSINIYAARAQKAQAAKDAVIYVACLKDTLIVKAFYTLSSGSVMRDQALRSMQRNSPGQHPVTILGRLGVDLDFQGRGIGESLLRDAIVRALSAAEIVASRALVIHALNPKLADFYVSSVGFIPSPISPLTLMLPLR